VTLNLGGHAIRLEGETAGTAITGEPYNAERHNVTIENGVLDRGGINMLYPTAVVRGLTLVRGASILLLVARALIEDNEIVGPGSIYLGVNYESRVRHNVIRGGGGISVGDGSQSVSITDNVISEGWGVSLYRSNGEIARNRILDGIDYGISLGRSFNDDVHDNVISGNVGGISVGFDSRASIDRNVITHNSANGIRTSDDDVFLAAQGNTISHNGENGVLVGETYGNAFPVGTELIGNTISANALDGVHVEQTDREPVVLQGNRTDRNGDDGIDTGDPNTTLTGNHAWFNGDLGIEAVPGVSGGGNWAKHNGNPAQCVPAFLCGTKGRPRG
jgi:hypothetical protein